MRASSSRSTAMPALVPADATLRDDGEARFGAARVLHDPVAVAILEADALQQLPRAVVARR